MKIRSKKPYKLQADNLEFNDLIALEDLTQADILVRSGHYFATLATRLDNLSLDLEEDQAHKDLIQSIVEELLYLQEEYQIKNK